jgi:hypothetical protein
MSMTLVVSALCFIAYAWPQGEAGSSPLSDSTRMMPL